MKKIILISFISFIVLSCSDKDIVIEQPIEQVKFKDIHFDNKTDYPISVEDIYKSFTSFVIQSNESKIIKIKEKDNCYILPTYPITEKIIEYENFIKDHYVFYQYNFKVQYRISGTASSVFVTLNNESGGTSQYSKVKLPVTYDYKKFNDKFVYVSAQNEGASGSVTVEIYYKDKLLKKSTSEGEYVIATASGSI
jgi:hypothetical protein